MISTKILDVRIDLFKDLVDAWKFISSHASSGLSPKTRLICTTNPEFILEAQKNAAFRQMINDAFLSTADGRGVILGTEIQKNYLAITSRSDTFLYKLFLLLQVTAHVLYDNFFRNTILAESITGVELFEKICQESSIHGYTLALVGGWPRNMFGKPLTGDYNIAYDTKLSMEAKYPGCKIVYANSSYSYKDQDDTNWIHDIKDQMKNYGITSIDFLFVAFGQYNQENWILRNGDRINAKIAIGVGRTFDYFSGYAFRPPYILKKYGLSWTYSLVREPWRLRRIFNAVVIFPFKFFSALLKAR